MTHPDDPDVLGRISEGDLLWIRPSVGSPYTCRVREVDRDDETVTVRREECDAYGGVTRRDVTMHADALIEAFVNADLMINPNRPAYGDGRAARTNRGP